MPCLQAIADQGNLIPTLTSQQETGSESVKEKATEVYEKLIQLVQENNNKDSGSGGKYSQH